ncbi:MAG: hypothetical protein B7X92_10335 [Novosphingobium sp. 17-62-9]|nr:MAG: hypothetical protein B7Z36_02330 [Novosphingobium sp. 12-63-9]OZA34372.1 MAG: hypothetical protein B7X92_10335 [Novosphingobium sp. 17-62-9]
MTEVVEPAITNGSVDPAHYGPIGDAARHIASYCEGNARVHVYTAAFNTLSAWNTRTLTPAQAAGPVLPISQLRIGDQVVIPSNSEKPWTHDWPEQYYIAGLGFERDGTPNVYLSENWPPEPGVTDGFRPEDIYVFQPAITQAEGPRA